MKNILNLIDWLNQSIIPFICVSLAFAIFFVFWDVIKAWKKRQLQDLKKAFPKNAHGIIFGKKGLHLIYSPESSEEHVLCCAATGKGKTSSIGIPTLRSWKGTSYTIDLSSDICRNCPDVPHKLVYEPEDPDTTPYNIFGAIDALSDADDKNEALEQLAFLLMPEPPNMNDNARFFLVNGRKILTASLISFYWNNMDFIKICEKIVSSSWQELFSAIDATQNRLGMMYISSFLDASAVNTAGCKQACDDAIMLFATNKKIKRSIRRPVNNEIAIEPKKLEKHNLFIVIEEDKLALYSPLMNILTSQVMQYIATRKVTPESPTILLFLDEFGSLRLDAELVLDAVRRFRKRKCRIMLLMQNTVDMDILYGNDTTRAILANLYFKVLLGGLCESRSQLYFAELLGHKETKSHSVSSNSTQTTRTESDSKDWVIAPEDFDKQGKDNLILIAPNEANGYLKLKKNYYFK